VICVPIYTLRPRTNKSNAKKWPQWDAACGLLRAHGLIAKVSKTHRYIVTEKGRNVITALLAARNASTEKLTALAA
jgi:hypothetical protein